MKYPYTLLSHAIDACVIPPVQEKKRMRSSFLTVFYTYFVHNIKKQFLPIKTVKAVDIIILNHYYRFI